MPELPEVERMVVEIRQGLGVNIERVDVLRDNGRYLPGDEIEQVRGNQIRSVERHGKYIVFNLRHGHMVCHNAMSGYWDRRDRPWTFDYVEGRRESSEKDVRVVIHTNVAVDPGPDRVLRFHDSRLFGSLRWLERLDLTIGPEAMGTPCCPRPEVTVDGLFASSRHCGKSVKEFLMDQRGLAGVGNIYASEGLQRAHVSPHRQTNGLTMDELQSVLEGVRGAFRDALRCDLRYPEYLRVYRRKTCGECGGEVVRTKIAGRSSFHCVKCQ